MRCRILMVLLLVGVFAFPVRGQISLSGLAEFELRKGGLDSAPAVNQTPDDDWLVYVPTVRLFVNAPISNNWSFSSSIQYDYYRGKRSPLFFSTANIRWMPRKAFNLTVGRFVTPYGRYDELLLSSNNPFVHLPLTHVWTLPVDRKRGYVFAPTSYSSGGIEGMSMVYQRMYSNGVMVAGATAEETLEYQLAATFTSVSSFGEVDQLAGPAVVGRLEVQPVIWNTIGISFSRGPYMIDQGKAGYLLSDVERSDYLQNIVTGYTSFSYRYYKLLLQYTFNRWDSPCLEGGAHVSCIDAEGNIVDRHMNTDISHYLAKFKMRFPFWVGGYGAMRYELYRPEPISAPRLHTHPWKPTSDKQRLEFVLGYQIDRNLLLKTSYLWSRNEGPELQDNVFTIQLSAGF